MKLILAILIAVSGLLQVQAGQMDDKAINKKVQQLLAKMSIEEKVGQMTQVTLQAVSKVQGTRDQKHVLDDAKLEEAITKYHVGSILNVFDVAHPVEYWHEILNKIQKIALEKTPNKIPVMYGIDAIHGATYSLGATLFPQAINMAATFNKELEFNAGAITSRETKASGIPWNFYPVLDIGRNQLWPRLWETFGEDVHLVTEMGRAYIRGAQGDNPAAKDKLAICLKHYVGYGFPMNGKDRTPAWISERMLREYFLPPFEAAVKEGALTVMVNSAENDGIPSHSDKHILTDILRGEMKFKGLTVSDWEDIKRLHTRDRVAATPKEAVKMAVMAGLDMSMVPYEFSFYNLLLELVKEGSVPVARINEAVSRILYVKFKIGLMDTPYPEKTLLPEFASEAHTKANLEAAQESIILAKNSNGILPLVKYSNVLVTGPTANMLSVLNGGWTITWQGNEESLYPKNKATILKAVQEKIGTANVTFVENNLFDKETNTAAAVEAAKKADAVILCLGENTYCETPGNIDDLTLPEAQLQLAHKIAATGKPVILVMIGGRPRVIHKIVPEMNAVVLGFLPGMEGGRAIADVIFGDVNPSGKLPITWPKAPNDLLHYDYKPLEFADVKEYIPEWNFGHGLSYTTFAYSGLKSDKDTYKANEDIKLTVTIKNTGKKAGKETVLVYITDMYGSVSRPNKQLKAFDKISLAAGEEKTVTITVKGSELSFIGRDNKRVIEPGEFVITVGSLTQRIIVK
ncbi:MAG: glycoside hydrolase family 3 C-terminal domain-containing protein [Ignavibacteriales bacterium]|nr:glycoside hydrolase family 3 C-terminal domain-containing protein [Ignavibacteriales bacterium]